MSNYFLKSLFLQICQWINDIAKFKPFIINERFRLYPRKYGGCQSVSSSHYIIVSTLPPPTINVPTLSLFNFASFFSDPIRFPVSLSAPKASEFSVRGELLISLLFLNFLAYLNSEFFELLLFATLHNFNFFNEYLKIRSLLLFF